MNELIRYGAEQPGSIDGLFIVNKATAEAAGVARNTGVRDATAVVGVSQMAASVEAGHLGVDRIVNHLKNRGYTSLSEAQYARIRSAVVDRIERYLDLWQAGRLPKLDVTTTTTTTT